MDKISYEIQIEAIRKVGKEALKTKETARQFLIDAGIIQDKKSNAMRTPNKKISKP